MKAAVLVVLAAAGAAASSHPGAARGAGGFLALVHPGGAIVASGDGGGRWHLVHVCPTGPGQDLSPPPRTGTWEVVAAEDALPGARRCPEQAPVLSWSGAVLRFTCDGHDLWQWHPGQSRATPVGDAACLPADRQQAAPPTAAAPATPVLVPRRARYRPLVPALSIGIERRRERTTIRGHAIGDGRRDDTIFWIRLTWRLDELARPAPTTSRSLP